MDLTGINNQNEYYTNHYFTSIFELNASETIGSWKKECKEEEKATPWAKFRETSKQYYRTRDKYQHIRNERQSKLLISEMATLFLNALGYEKINPVTVEVADGIVVPVYHEETKANGAPLLWVVLSVAEERGDDILKGMIFGDSENEEGDDGVELAENNDMMLSKMFFAGEEAPRWIILIGINQIALIDRNKWNEKRYLQFDLDEIFSRHEETTFQAVSVLLHKTSLCPVDGISILDTLDENSHKHSAGVSDSLKYALRECIELLGNEVLYDRQKRAELFRNEEPVDAAELTIECLRYMYRVLFMLFIEARPELGYAPMKTQAYVQGYSLEGLRDICETVRDESEEVSEGYYIDETMSKLFKLIYEGYPGDEESYKKALKLKSVHDAFMIEPLKAHIFDPQYTKMITKAKLRNVTMLKIVDLMSISRPNGNKERKGRISYSALGINQMGAVYEALLSYRGFIAEETLFEVKRADKKFNELDVGYFVPERELDNYTEEERVRYEKGDKKGQLRKYEKGTFIYRLAGREREKSASYYTPEVLTKCLVKYALKELLQGKTADEILSLTVCEPAMGSAAFLNEAINQLAEAYLNKKQEELGITIEFDKRLQELQRVKMYIADRNVYGVDLNPIAVELAEVSLWLNTIYEGAYVPWFGTQLVCGNSLIGARRQVYNTNLLVKGKWYEEEPRRVMPGETRVRSGATWVYHFLLGDPGMANYTDKDIKKLEPENIKTINEWRKKFTAKYSEDEIQSLLRLSEVIDDLWQRTVYMRQTVKRATAESLSVFGHEEAENAVHTTIREKDAILHRIYKSEGGENASPYARLKAAMDYWCALWFWPINKADLLPDRKTFIMDMDMILEGGIASVDEKATGQMTFVDVAGNMISDENGNVSYGIEGSEVANRFREECAGLGIVNLEQLRGMNERLDTANKIAEQQKFQHWELEFAEIFEDKGGFDLVIGNPPWLKITWNERAVLADRNPIFLLREISGTPYTQMRYQTLRIVESYKTYFNEYEALSGTQNFLNSVEAYSLLRGQQTNLYKCFLPTAWMIGGKTAVSAFVHPDGVFNDPEGKMLRKQIYPRLRKHFHFINELLLFKEVGHPETFSLNVYCNTLSDSFQMINNLFDPVTIDECYNKTLNFKLLGIKDEHNRWNLHGNPDRIVNVSKNELILFAEVFDENSSFEGARLPILHCKQLIDVISCFSRCQNKSYSKNKECFFCEMWHEANAQSDGTIKQEVQFPEEDIQFIYSGPHIGVSNPLNQTPRRVCIKKGDYDKIDLTNIKEDYIPRTKYSLKCNINEYLERIPKTKWSSKYTDEYRLVSRKMLNLKQERTLISAIIPPKCGHINGLHGLCFRNRENLVLASALYSSLPYDLFIKVIGKTNLYEDTASKLPIFKSSFSVCLESRALLLNCLNENYSSLYNENRKYTLENDLWAKEDNRLNHARFAMLNSDWNIKTPLRTDYERREALVEIDVLTAMALDMTLEQLKTIYRIQFPVLQSYERDTWYDQNGRIVFTNNRSLTNVGFTRKEWEQIKDAKQGTFTRIIIDDTIPEGPLERTIEYVAPFDRCDREKDYEEVWHNFEQRFKDKK